MQSISYHISSRVTRLALPDYSSSVFSVVVCRLANVSSSSPLRSLAASCNRGSIPRTIQRFLLCPTRIALNSTRVYFVALVERRRCRNARAEKWKTRPVPPFTKLVVEFGPAGVLLLLNRDSLHYQQQALWMTLETLCPRFPIRSTSKHQPVPCPSKGQVPFGRIAGVVSRE